MAQRRFDWIVGDWNDFDEFRGVAPSHSWSYQSADTVATHLISNEDLTAKNDRLRVERVIGQVVFQFVPFGLIETEGPVLPYNPGTLLFLKERIYVHDARDSVTPDSAQDTLGVNAFDDADRSFLWERTRVLDIGGMGGEGTVGLENTILVNCQQNVSNAGQGNVALDGSLGYSMIDVGVKRVLTGRQLLVYQVQTHPWDTQGGVAPMQFTMHAWQWFRVGVKF